MTPERNKEIEEERKRLLKAFNLVSNKENWKMPIDCIIKADKALQNEINEATIYFAGSPCIFIPTDKKGYVRVRALGYYTCIGA